jgi:hypothetical protein
MVWGGISSRNATPLVFIKGGVVAEKYIKVLVEGLLSTMNFLYPDGFIFQRDNVPAHRANITKRWLRDRNLVIMDWPALFPDLSPIENLWAIIKNEIETTKPMKMDQMMAKINEIWGNFGPTFLAQFLESMPSRLEKCIASEERTIKI